MGNFPSDGILERGIPEERTCQCGTIFTVYLGQKTIKGPSLPARECQKCRDQALREFFETMEKEGKDPFGHLAKSSDS